jgi:hypothetical protein
MKSKLQKQTEALARREADLKFWTDDLALVQGNLDRGTAREDLPPDIKQAYIEGLSLDVAITQRKVDSATKDIASLRRKLGIEN